MSTSPDVDPLNVHERHLVTVTQIVCAIAAALIVWEYLLFFPREIWIIRRSKLSPGIAALVVNRYGGVLGAIFTCVFVLGNAKTCKDLGWLMSVSFVLQQAASSYIFLLRSKSIWDNSRMMTIILAIGCLVVTGSWMASSWSITYEEIPNGILPYGGRCLIGSTVGQWRVLAAAATTAFDVLVLALSVMALLGYTVKLGGTKKAQYAVHKLALSSLSFYIPVTVLNVGAMLLIALASPHVRSLALTYTSTVSQIAASRLIFDMLSVSATPKERIPDTSEAFSYPYPTGNNNVRLKEDQYSIDIEGPPERGRGLYDFDNNVQEHERTQHFRETTTGGAGGMYDVELDGDQNPPLQQSHDTPLGAVASLPYVGAVHDDGDDDDDGRNPFDVPPSPLHGSPPGGFNGGGLSPAPRARPVSAFTRPVASTASSFNNRPMSIHKDHPGSAL